MTGCGRGKVGKSTSVLSGINTTEGKLAVSVVVIASRFWLEVNAKNLTSDGALGLEVVQEGWDGREARNGTLSKVNWTNAENAIDARESRSAGGSTNGLRLDGKTAKADNVCVLLSRERTTTVRDRDGTTRGYTS